MMIRVLHAEHGLSDIFIAYVLARNIRVEEDLIDQMIDLHVVNRGALGVRSPFDRL